MCYLKKANYPEDDINLAHLRIGLDSVQRINTW